MERVIIIRYSEIHLKGKNRSFFEDLLKNNIKNVVKKYGATLTKIPGRYMVDNLSSATIDPICDDLQKIAGIFSFSVASQIDSDYQKIKQETLAQMQDKTGTFKVVVNRGDKSFGLNSMQLARELGGDILESNRDLSVDVINPQTKLCVDIRENNKTYIFSEIIYGMGGMPVGSSGKGLLLLSGGIDSPVAGYMMAKRGAKLVAIHYHSFPYTSELARVKVEKLAQKLVPYNGGDITVYMVNMAKYQETIHSKCNDSYMITLLRRGMFRIAEQIAKRHNIEMLITGENLGQVASQTIQSMTVVEDVVESVPILRPLVAFDKVDIINVAKKIDTYETSIEPYEDCCTVFLPDNPVTKPRLEMVKMEESKFDYETLLEEAMSQIECIKFN